MIKNKVYRLKQAAEVAKDMALPAGQEIEVVMGVVYVNGNLVPPTFQELFMNWLENNPSLFEDDTRNW
jgi:hypothetical protein